MLQLLTAKPVLYVCNVDEARPRTGERALGGGGEEARGRAAPVRWSISAPIEAEIAELDDAERAEFLETLGLTSPASTG